MPTLKPSVEFDKTSPEIWYALGAADMWSMLHDQQPRVVTALQDGHHNPGSLHAQGKAVDFRAKDLPQAFLFQLFSDLRKLLDPQGFDVVNEGAGATAATTAAHVHIEFQPKGSESFIKREGVA
jgi:hypothetical protein